MATIQSPSEGRSLCHSFSFSPCLNFSLSRVSSKPVVAPRDVAKSDTDASVNTDDDISIYLPVFLDTHWPPVSSESGLTSSHCVQVPARPNSVLCCLPPQSHLY